MPSNLQVMIYEGHLARTPEMRYTPKGQAVTNFSVGSNHEFKSADGTVVKQTTWLRCTAWGKLAEIVNEWTDKGSHVIITGRLTPAEDGNPKVYEAKDGTSKASNDVIVSSIRIIKGKSSDAPKEEFHEEEETDNIPF